MAGDWIKIRCDLDDDPAVIVIAERIGCNVDEVVGKLCRFWSWTNRQSRDGHVPVTLLSVDRHVRCDGFAQAMVEVGWLEASPTGGFVIPNWNRHNSKSAKERALAASRKVTQRSRSRHAPVTERALPEKRRDKKKKPKKVSSAEEPEPMPKKGTPNPIWDALCAAFGLKPVTEAERSRVGRIVRDLKAKEARPEEIALRLERYRQEWPNAAATPEALLKHWDTFAKEKTHGRTGNHSRQSGRISAPEGKYAGVGRTIQADPLPASPASPAVPPRPGADGGPDRPPSASEPPAADPG